VRDLAAFMLHLIEQRAFGTFNADAPGGKLTMGELIDTCQRVAAKPSTVTWVPAAFLDKQQVSAWQDMPVWIPAEGENAGFGRVSSAKAQAAGLTYRPLETTVADTLAYWRSLPPERRAAPKAGLPPEREAAVLKAWHASLEPKPVKKSTSKKSMSKKSSSKKKSSSSKKKH